MIIPMRYISVVCMKEDRSALLSALQKSGKVMLVETAEVMPSELYAGEQMRRMEKLMGNMKPYVPKKGMFAQAPEVDAARFECEDEKSLLYADEMETLLAKQQSLETENGKVSGLLELLLPWEPLPVAVNELAGTTDYTTTVTGILPLSRLEGCKEDCAEAGIGIDVASIDSVYAYITATVMKGESLALLNDYRFEPVSLPDIRISAMEQCDRLREQLTNIRTELEQTKARLTELGESCNAPELMYERYRAANERELAPVGETMTTVYVNGWIKAEELEEVERVIKSVTAIYDLESREPLPDEDVPTALKNNKIVTQFEGITNMFNVPKYGEVDPNPVMAPWYWIIFGLMMGDAGYGLMMVAGALLLKKLMKPKGSTAGLINVVLYSSITSVIAGVVFGSYFGETWNPLLFSPLESPMEMLIFTLIIGALHIFTGMIRKMVMDIQEGHPWDAIFDQLSWIILITGVGFIFLPALSTIGMYMAVGGAVVIVLTAGRKKKGIFSKITGGLLGLYNITSYFSDILSYSRILALSLATGVVGMVMNMLAGMLQGNPIGFIFSLAVYVVGHVFNLALGLLSAYVHDCRLQYIEFYGKFFEGGGRLFEPFSIQTKYIQIKHDEGETK